MYQEPYYDERDLENSLMDTYFLEEEEEEEEEDSADSRMDSTWSSLLETEE